MLPANLDISQLLQVIVAASSTESSRRQLDEGGYAAGYAEEWAGTAIALIVGIILFCTCVGVGVCYGTKSCCFKPDTPVGSSVAVQQPVQAQGYELPCGA